MQKITQISGLTIPLDKADVDTDLIIPAQYLTQVTKQGYGQALFRRLRDMDPDFVFNQPRFDLASIIIARENFGCGSSREHAVWALTEKGIKAIIAPSFSDIFFNNSAKNGLLLIVQPLSSVKDMIKLSQNADYTLTIDIEKQEMIDKHQTTFHFEMEEFRKYCFINGLDELDYLLSHSNKIKDYDLKVNKMKYSRVFSAVNTRG